MSALDTASNLASGSAPYDGRADATPPSLLRGFSSPQAAALCDSPHPPAGPGGSPRSPFEAARLRVALDRFLLASCQCAASRSPVGIVHQATAAAMLPGADHRQPDSGTAYAAADHQTAGNAAAGTESSDSGGRLEAVVAAAAVRSEQPYLPQQLRVGVRCGGQRAADGKDAALAGSEADAQSPVSAAAGVGRRPSTTADGGDLQTWSFDDAALLPRQDSFEVKWGRWADDMIDACLADIGDLDDDCSSDSEFGGAAAEFIPECRPEQAVGAAISASSSSTSGSAACARSADESGTPDFEPDAVPGSTSMDPLREAAAASGIYDDIAAAEQEATRATDAAGGEDGAALGNTPSTEGCAPTEQLLPPGWQLADASKELAQTARLPGADGMAPLQQGLGSCSETDGQLRAGGRDGGGATALFWLCFHDAAVERRYCSYRGRLLRPFGAIALLVVATALLYSLVLRPAVLAQTSPLLLLCCTVAEMQLILVALLRVRFCVWLPAQLASMLAIAAIPHLGGLHQAIESGLGTIVASLAQRSLSWEAACQLALGLALPDTVMWLLERRERRQFVARMQSNQSAVKA